MPDGPWENLFLQVLALIGEIGRMAISSVKRLEAGVNTSQETLLRVLNVLRLDG